MIDFYVGVPFTNMDKEVPATALIATREDEAIGIAVGAWFAGKTPLVFMQNSGIGKSLDIITSLLKPYGIEIDLLISNRKKPDHHLWMWLILAGVMGALKYDKVRYC